MEEKTSEYRKNTYPTKFLYGILIPNNLTATVTLPPLNDGYHILTVNAREPYIVPAQSGYYYRQETVEFTVSTTPPSISLSSIKNKTFTSSDVPLTFSTNKPHVGLCYSLDGQSNVTISGKHDTYRVAERGTQNRGLCWLSRLQRFQSIL